jgi:hypothetical protein
METTVDPAVSSGASRVEELKATVTSKMDELRNRFSGLNREELEAKIVANPWPAVGGAFALGLVIALGRGRKEPKKRSLGGMVVAGVGAVAVRLLKSYAISQLGDAAKNWMAGDESPTERVASKDPAVESFLEH